MGFLECFNLRLIDFDKLVAVLNQDRILLTFIFAGVFCVQAINPLTAHGLTSILASVNADSLGMSELFFVIQVASVCLKELIFAGIPVIEQERIPLPELSCAFLPIKYPLCSYHPA